VNRPFYQGVSGLSNAWPPMAARSRQYALQPCQVDIGQGTIGGSATIGPQGNDRRNSCHRANRRLGAKRQQGALGYPLLLLLPIPAHFPMGNSPTKASVWPGLSKGYIGRAPAQARPRTSASPQAAATPCFRQETSLRSVSPPLFTHLTAAHSDRILNRSISHRGEPDNCGRVLSPEVAGRPVPAVTALAVRAYGSVGGQAAAGSVFF